MNAEAKTKTKINETIQIYITECLFQSAEHNLGTDSCLDTSRPSTTTEPTNRVCCEAGGNYLSVHLPGITLSVYYIPVSLFKCLKRHLRRKGILALSTWTLTELFIGYLKANWTAIRCGWGVLFPVVVVVVVVI
ncbi:hypothetical protein E2C01_038444 [Portunus trituberculatus]|uniref:Uncharacterized protein n=1 Tax=Portunus trituberculatus TaxID=210409 RepID=A0A5B7FK54_PORTR|nr:hypothetical protein [Portunus trituberculatus]